MKILGLTLLVLCFACNRQDDWTTKHPYEVVVINNTAEDFTTCRVSYGRFSTLDPYQAKGGTSGQFPVTEPTPANATVKWETVSGVKHQVTVAVDVVLPAEKVRDLVFTINPDMTVVVSTRERRGDKGQ